ncbi:hypothetical protein CAC42_4260 [Sphaceloma murrayae]|uniref:Uncharacterized protein n=1 Tax=Sphaceloma murrayae TaxID=2082308 RepID=A0A2K1QKW4_9PEZI|nr:hypothetical protein CAC42_4260 [Sphaceloma murrayae]
MAAVRWFAPNDPRRRTKLSSPVSFDEVVTAGSPSHLPKPLVKVALRLKQKKIGPSITVYEDERALRAVQTYLQSHTCETNAAIRMSRRSINQTYFGPKGLCVGFDLPGPIFRTTFVHPKRRFFLFHRVLDGTLKKPIRPSRAARRSRITIARVRDPVPDAGRPPIIAPLVLPAIQRFLDALKNRPKDFVEAIEDKANERMAVIAELRARRQFLLASENLIEIANEAVDSEVH